MRRAYLQKKESEKSDSWPSSLWGIPRCLTMGYRMGREMGLVPRTVEHRRGVSLSSRQGLVIIDGEDVPVLADGIDFLSDRSVIQIVEGTVQMDDIRG